MTSDEKQKSTIAARKPASANKTGISQSDIRKKRLAEQLRMNLRNRKAQTRLRRNFDKTSDD